MDIKKRNKSFDKYFNSTECEVKAFTLPLLTSNGKLDKTTSNSDNGIAYGLEFIAAYKQSCIFASCHKTCIIGSGVQNIFLTHKNEDELSSTDKNRLARYWLFINKQEIFHKKLQLEIDQIILQNPSKQIFIRLDVFSELNIKKDYSLLYPSIIFYDYFKSKKRIIQDYSDNDLNIYSWNENSSNDDLNNCHKRNIPVATVIPYNLFTSIFGKKNKKQKNFIELQNCILVNGDKSDLHCFNYDSDKPIISLLSYKNNRYKNKVGSTPFLESYSKLFNFIEYSI